jgi:coenzyme F420-reducing hydrogenase delta subunit
MFVRPEWLISLIASVSCTGAIKPTIIVEAFTKEGDEVVAEGAGFFSVFY